MSASTRLFGTDGIRGVFGEPPLVEPTVTALGAHLATRLQGGNGQSPRVTLGGDTRHSTPQLCQWLANGLQAGGAEVLYGGVLPTPAVAHLTRSLGADAGVAVSASHNPARDNGIKLLTADGFKWSRDDEQALEESLGRQPEVAAPAFQLEPEPGLANLYLDALAGSLGKDPSLGEGRSLEGLRLALDTAHGAASAFAGDLFRRLGAEVTVYYDQPNGHNINDGCGSTHPEALAPHLAGGTFDLGFTFDGDADRALMVDETGRVRDGDAMLYLWASDLAARAELNPPAIVATSMSNLGLARALDAQGIELVRCGVGDREVVETLKARRLRLGGEQSGHLVDLTLSSTGDGLLTALQIAGLVARSGRKVSELLAGFRRYPQILLNVEVRSKPAFDEVPAIQEKAQDVESALGDDGRLVLRYSGTEPLARVMIEGPEQATIDRLAGELAAVIEDSLG